MRTLGFLLLASAMAPAPAAAQDAPPVAPAVAFDPADPRHADLYALEHAADELQDNGPQDAPGRRATIAAWDKLREAASATSLPGGEVHPLAYLADIKVASQLYTLGELGEGTERARRGIAGLQPYVAHYPIAYGEALALVGVMMAQQGRAEEALPMVEQGYDAFARYYDALPAAGIDRPTGTTRSNLEFARSQVLLRLGRTEDALRWQRASLDTRRARLGETDPDTVSSYYGLAQVLLRNEDAAGAEAMARKAVELAVTHVDKTHPARARALEMLGIVLSRTGRPIEATDYLIQALALKRENEGTDNVNFGYGMHNLGAILLGRERYADAEPFFLDADAAFRASQGEASPFAAGAIAYAGRIAFAEGRPQQAIERFERASVQLGNKRDEQILSNILPDMSRALLAAGDTARAVERATDYRDLLNAVDNSPPFAMAFARLLLDNARARSGALPPDAAAGSAQAMLETIAARQGAHPATVLSQDVRDALDLVLEVAVAAGRTDLVAEAINRLNASSVALASRRLTERLEATDPALGEALKQLQDAALRFEDAEGRYLALLGKGEYAGAEKASRDEALAALERSRAALAAAFPTWSENSGAKAASVDSLSASLGPGEAILAIAPAYDSTYLLAVTRAGAQAARIEAPRAATIALVRRLGEAIRTGGYDAAAAQELYRQLFPSAIDRALAGADTLYIQAGGELASLPLAVLQGAGAGGDGWLGDRFALASLADLAPLRPERRRQETAASFVAVADPVPFAEREGALPAEGGAIGITGFFDRGGADPAALSRLPRLERSAAEARSIAASLPGATKRLLLAGDATEAAIRGGALSEAQIILFGTHGLVSGEIEGVAEPALVLTPPRVSTATDDGLLTASEIAGLDLAAQWIILSACNSASPGGAGLPAFSGLARAFRHAGGETLMVSHWQVRDDVAAFLTIETLKGYRAGLSRPKALQAAIAALRRSREIAGADQPFSWAPFVLLE